MPLPAVLTLNSLCIFPYSMYTQTCLYTYTNKHTIVILQNVITHFSLAYLSSLFGYHVLRLHGFMLCGSMIIFYCHLKFSLSKLGFLIFPLKSGPHLAFLIPWMAPPLILMNMTDIYKSFLTSLPANLYPNLIRYPLLCQNVPPICISSLPP